MNDCALLRRYAETQADEAFAILVARYVNLVYSIALRQVGNSHHAQEITQAVFIILATKVPRLRHENALSSWLFQTTRLTARNFTRSERRRQNREQESFMQSTLDESGEDLWQRIAPMLDDAVAALGEKDRRAVLLRFYEGRNLREIGTVLDTSEDAAEKRVTRAVEKLRKFFTKHGIALTTTALSAAISINSVQAAPVGLAITVTTTKGTAVSSSILTIVKGALKIMAWIQAKTAVVVGAAVILTAGTVTVIVKENYDRPGYYNGKSLSEWLVDLDDQHRGPAYDEAAAAVRHIGTNGLPLIIGMLRLDNPMHRNAVLACQQLGPEAKPAIPALMKLLNDGYARGYVGVAMARIGQDGIAPLTTALTNENAEVRVEVAHGLGGMLIYSGDRDIQLSAAISTLITCLADKAPSVRAIAAISLCYLAEVQGTESTVVPALIKSLDDSHIWTRWNSCLALGQFGARAKSAIPALSAKLDSDARGTAAIALVKIEPENSARIISLMPILIENIEGIDGTNTNYRSSTADALASIGEIAKPAVPALVKAAEVATGYERNRIVMALKRIDPTATENAGLK